MEIDRKRFIDWVKQYTDYNLLSQEVNEAFQGWSLQDQNLVFSKSKDILKVIEKIVNLVEKFSKDIESLSSKDKLELVVDFLDDIIKFNFFLEWFDGMAIKYIITTIVEYKNQFFGKEWGKDKSK